MRLIGPSRDRRPSLWDSRVVSRTMLALAWLYVAGYVALGISSVTSEGLYVLGGPAHEGATVWINGVERGTMTAGADLPQYEGCWVYVRAYDGDVIQVRVVKDGAVLYDAPYVFSNSSCLDLSDDAPASR